MTINQELLQAIEFPIVENIHDLSEHTHLSRKLLYIHSKHNDKFYKIFTKPKKNSGVRTISCPAKSMKAVQAWILRNILDKIQIANCATGFKQRKNVFHNVEPHKNSRNFLCMDIENFFTSIPYSKVYTVFRIIGYNAHVSHIFASLCTGEGKLPQGAVTSPSLSNIICIRLDNRISGYVKKRNIIYTRYADDLTFSSSSSEPLVRSKNFVVKIVEDEGFEINENKTRFMGPRSQRKVTGLVLSDDQVIRIGRKRKRLLRAAIHRLNNANLSDFEKIKLKNYIDGWFAYLKSVDIQGHNQLKKYETRLL